MCVHACVCFGAVKRENVGRRKKCEKGKVKEYERHLSVSVIGEWGRGGWGAGGGAGEGVCRVAEEGGGAGKVKMQLLMMSSVLASSFVEK